MFQDIYQKAIKFAAEKHAFQTIKGSNSNYVLHISNVAMEVIIAHKNEPCFDLDYAVQLALLHDTLEDTDTTITELKNEFGEKVANGVLALTKDSNSPRHKQIENSLNKINKMSIEVGIVKLADRITNLQKPPDFWNSEKRKNYLEDALQISNKLKNKNKYLEKRLLNKISEYEVYI